jgi:hypothetical protein
VEPAHRFDARWPEAASPFLCHLVDRHANSASVTVPSRRSWWWPGRFANSEWTRWWPHGRSGEPTRSPTSLTRCAPFGHSRLAPYTQEAYIAAGESTDIDDATPAQSQIKAFVFDTYGTFTLFGQDNELRLCLLKRHGVYPFTDLGRDSVPSG